MEIETRDCLRDECVRACVRFECGIIEYLALPSLLRD